MELNNDHGKTGKTVFPFNAQKGYKRFFFIFFLCLFSLNCFSKIDTIKLTANRDIFYLSGESFAKQKTTDKLFASEFALLNFRKEKICFYNANTECLIYTRHSNLKIDVLNVLPDLFEKTNKTVVLYTDTYFYKNKMEAGKLKRFNPALRKYTVRELRTFNKRFRQTFITRKSALKQDIAETTNWIKRLFIASLNNSAQSQKYLEHFKLYYLFPVDGELAETLRQYQTLLSEYKNEHS